MNNVVIVVIVVIVINYDSHNNNNDNDNDNNDNDNDNDNNDNDSDNNYIVSLCSVDCVGVQFSLSFCQFVLLLCLLMQLAGGRCFDCLLLTIVCQFVLLQSIVVNLLFDYVLLVFVNLFVISTLG